MERKIQHLQLIQGIVNRLAQNSFLIKGWTVTLVSALFALAAPGASIGFVYLAYIPAVVFWGLDGYFLWQERLFRDHYDHVRGLENEAIDFSMDTSTVAASRKWGGTVMSKTLLAFHGSLIASIIVVMIFILSSSGGASSGT